MRAWKAEKAMQEKMKKELEDALPKLNPDHTFTPNTNGEGNFQGLSFDFSQDMPRIEIELKR